MLALYVSPLYTYAMHHTAHSTQRGEILARWGFVHGQQ